jgi:hypothetical protein
MTDVLVMKRSSLVLPNGFVEIDREEMSYVEGGTLYLPNWFCGTLVALAGATVLLGTGYMIASGSSAIAFVAACGIQALGPAILKAIFAVGASLGPVGVAISIAVAALGSTYVALNKSAFLELGYNVVLAAVNGCGVGINFGFFKFSSYVD